MQSVRQKTHQALRQHAVALLVLIFVGVGIALVLWTAGGFERANPAGLLGSDVAVFVTLAGLAFSSACLVITDFAHHLLPHVIMVPTACWVILAMIVVWISGGDGAAVLWALAAGAVTGVTLFAVAMVPGAGLGGGDVKLAALLATTVAWLHPAGLLIALVVALAAATLWALAVVVMKRGTLKTAIPLGPFLILGAWAALVTSAM